MIITKEEIKQLKKDGVLNDNMLKTLSQENFKMISLEIIKEIYDKHLEYLHNKEHIKRVWLNIINIKSYDLVSKHCLNPQLREILKSYGIKKSVEFSDPLKAYYKSNLFYFNEKNDFVRGY